LYPVVVACCGGNFISAGQKKRPDLPGVLHILLNKGRSIGFADLFHGQANTALLVHFKYFDLDHFTFLDHVGYVFDTFIGEL